MESLDVLTNVMKDYYEPSVPEIINQELDLYPDVEKNSEGVDGKNIIGVVQIGENERGLGNVREGGPMPIGGENEYEQCSAFVKFAYAVISLSRPALKLTTGVNTLIKLLSREMTSTMNAFKHDMNRQIHMDGTASIAQATAKTGHILTMDSVKFLRRGMYLDVYTGTTLRTPASTHHYITDVDHQNTKITLNDATNVVANDYIYRQGNVYVSGGSLVSNEITGLEAFYSASNTFENIDRAANSWWQATIKDNSGTNRALTAAIMLTAIDDHISRTGSVPDQFIGSLGMRRAFWSMLQTANQPREEIATKSGLRTGLAFEYGAKKIPVLGSRFGPSNKFRGMNLDNIEVKEGAPIEWCDMGGGILKPRETTDTYWGKLAYYFNLFTQRGDDFLEIGDITEV